MFLFEQLKGNLSNKFAAKQNSLCHYSATVSTRQYESNLDIKHANTFEGDMQDHEVVGWLVIVRNVLELTLQLRRL